MPLVGVLTNFLPIVGVLTNSLPLVGVLTNKELPVNFFNTIKRQGRKVIQKTC